MANIHFGRIGDIWKHLPLAEILAIEQPRQFWESHAGSAQYPLTPSLERDYGVFHFLKQAPQSEILAASAYFQFLTSLHTEGTLRVYPGSPLLALYALRAQAQRFVFCDLDEDSLATITAAASHLGIAPTKVETIHRDGVASLVQQLEALPEHAAASTLVHIDPYEPLEESAAGLNAFDLLCRLTARGIKCVLWYAYQSLTERAVLFQGLDQALARTPAAPATMRFWCGDVALAVMDDASFVKNSGVISCGIVCSHLSEESLSACTRLGEQLQRIYASAQLSSGHSGRLRFRSLILPDAFGDTRPSGWRRAGQAARDGDTD